MSTATNIATRSAAEAAVTRAVVVPIASVDYSLEDYRHFLRSVNNAARALPTTIGGGGHGHIFLLESHTDYTTRTGGTDYVEAAHPGAIDFTGATTNAQIARAKDVHATSLEVYNTQEGARAGLRKIIVANTPPRILVELEDPDSGLDEVEPRRLLELLKERAAPVTVTDAIQLRNARDAPLTFDTADTLATQFALSKKASGDLSRIHSITTSRSELMMMWLLEIEKNKDFEDQVMEWRARTTSNGFDDFVTFFSKRDIEVRRLNKMVAGRAAAAGYHSAANVTATNEYIDQRMNAKMANLAAAVEAAMNERAAAADGAYTSNKTDETAANATDKLTSASGQDAVLAALKSISDRLEKVEKMGGGRRRRGRGRGGGDDEADPKATDKGRKPCVHCGKRHKLPDEKCWALDANKGDRPANYVKPPPGFNKGN